MDHFHRKSMRIQWSWPFELFQWIFCMILHCLWFKQYLVDNEMWCQIYSTFQPFILFYHNYCMIFILKGPRQWQYLISLHLGAMQYDKGWCNWHHLLTKFVHQFMVSTHWSVSLNCAFGNVWCTMYPIRYGPYRNSGAQEYGIWTNTANIHLLSVIYQPVKT